MSGMGILLPFAALVVFALAAARRGIATAVAPLAVCCATSLYYMLFGMLGLLVVAGWIYHILALAAAVWLVHGWLAKGWRPRPGFGFWLWLGLSMGAILLFAARQPMFVEWDQFSTWSTIAKLMKLDNVMYTVAPIGWDWQVSQTPATTMLIYAMQFFGRGFIEWQAYAAVDMLQFAAVAALVAPFDKKRMDIAVPLAVAALVSPFVFSHYAHLPLLSQVYLTTLGDIPMSFMFAAALGIYFGGEGELRPRTLVPLCLSLAVLTLTKDLVGIALAMIVAALVFADQLLARRGEKPAAGKKRLTRAAGGLLATAGAALAAFLSWSVHLAVVADVSRTNLGGGGNVGMLEMPLRFLGELFAPEKSAKFLEVTGGMWRLFTAERITMLGSGLMVMCMFIGLVALAAAITKQAAHRRRCIVFGAFGALGFVAYYAFLTMYYLYIFTNDQMFTSYERYVYPYYMGCFLGALMLLGMAARESRLVVEGKAAVLAVCAVFCLRCVQLVPAAYSVIGFDKSYFDWRREFAAEVADITEYIEPESRTFLVSTGDKGFRYFVYTYEFLPWQMDYSFGGGPLQRNIKNADGSVDVEHVGAQEWAEYLEEKECGYVLIDDADEAFMEEYGHLFEDGVQGYLSEETSLYRVVLQDDGLVLQPVEMERTGA